jgi:hypothetical protein
MNTENDNTGDGDDEIAWFETEAAAFVGASSQAAGLSARVVRRIRRRTKPDRLLENAIFGFFRHGAQAALYVAAAYAAKIAFGIGHLSLSLK